MIEIPMYIPAVTGTGAEARMGDFFARTVKQGSAIVGEPKDDGMMLVYYEGNLYRASNMVTFADRAMCAYWRMRDHYPTVASMAVPLSQLHRIGTLYPDHGRIELIASSIIRCAHWLGLDPTSDELSGQLSVSLVPELQWGQNG